MSRKCDLNNSKKVMSGNNVSHSNRKTRRRFLPNLRVFTLLSDILGISYKFKLSTNTMRSIEHNDGLDNYLMKTPSSKLDQKAKTIKKALTHAIKKRSEQSSTSAE